MRSWLVGGAIVESDTGVLLVRNQRRDGRAEWSTPGGVIDEGEGLLEGLAREVTEETGLVVTGWEGPLYEVRARAPGLGWDLRVEVHLATGFEGELRVDDPDGIVVDACFVAPDRCRDHLVPGQPWVVEPLTAWLDERWAGGPPRSFVYDISGADRRSLAVARRHGAAGVGRAGQLR